MREQGREGEGSGRKGKEKEGRAGKGKEEKGTGPKQKAKGALAFKELSGGRASRADSLSGWIGHEWSSPG